MPLGLLRISHRLSIGNVFVRPKFHNLRKLVTVNQASYYRTQTLRGTIEINILAYKTRVRRSGCNCSLARSSFHPGKVGYVNEVQRRSADKFLSSCRRTDVPGQHWFKRDNLEDEDLH